MDLPRRAIAKNRRTGLAWFGTSLERLRALQADDCRIIAPAAAPGYTFRFLQTAGAALMLLYLLRVTFELGLPVAALSWLLFYRLYSRGELARDASHKVIRTDLKQIRQATKKSETPPDSVLHAKWMRFGGGFYGVTALWTLVVIETSGILTAIADPSSIEDLFRHGLVGFIVSLIVGQFTTFLQAILWFDWWPGHGGQTVVWIAGAYVGYLAGLNLARHETEFGSRLVAVDWRSQLRSRSSGDEDGSEKGDGE